MTDFYTQLIEKSGFDEVLVRHALDFAKNIDLNEFSRLFFDTEPFSVEKTGVLCFDEAFYPYEFFEMLKSFELPMETSSLLVYISLLERSFEDFSTRISGVSAFFDTAKKLVESSDDYFKQNGKYGLYDYRFVANHVRGNIVRLGGFEYQYGEYNGKKTIILHVPDKADLSKPVRLNSYQLARQFFGDFPIIGDSWLLYPEHKKMLSQDSNIVDFINDFDIVSINEITDYSELFHVFGRLRDFSYENLPKKTSLQKAYAVRVKNNLPIGSAVGKLKY